MPPKINIHGSNLKNVTAGPSATIVRLPLFRDGTFVGNEFIPISPRLRAKIRQMALEGRR